MINYITVKNNERGNVFSKRKQDVCDTGDDKFEYRMIQLLKPGILKFKQTEIEQSKTLKDSLQSGNFIKIQPVATGKNGVYFQPIGIETPENEWEVLRATAKNNDDVYQSVVGAIKKNARCLRFWF